MSKSKSRSKYTVRIDNVYFLSRIGLSLRWATQNIAREDLPVDIKRLLARLDLLEAQEADAQSQTAQGRTKGEPSDNDPAG